MDIKRLFSNKTEYSLISVIFDELPIDNYMDCDSKTLDSINLIETQNDKIVYTIKRHIYFEPKCIFDLSVELKVMKFFNDDVDINEIKDVEWQNTLFEERDFFSQNVMEEISLMIAFITKQSAYPTYITPPVFLIDEDLKEENS